MPHARQKYQFIGVDPGIFRTEVIISARNFPAPLEDQLPVMSSFARLAVLNSTQRTRLAKVDQGHLLGQIKPLHANPKTENACIPHSTLQILDASMTPASGSVT